MSSIFLDESEKSTKNRNKKYKVRENKKKSSLTVMDESSDMMFSRIIGRDITVIEEDILPQPENIPDGHNIYQPESIILKNIKDLIPAERLGIIFELPLAYMPFPDFDINKIRSKTWNISTRIGSEVGRYHRGQLILPPWGWRYLTNKLDGSWAAPYYVSEVQTFETGKDHPYYDQGTPKERKFLDTLFEKYEVVTIKPTHILRCMERFIPPKPPEELDDEHQNDELSIYRAKHGVEIIKYEKTFDQFLICQRNWFLMTPEQKTRSNSFSTRRFGAANIARIPQILREYKSFIDVGEFAERYHSIKDLLNL
jgi:hypothetical protein